MTYPSKKTYQQFISEAYSQTERQSHITPKPTTIQTITRTAKDDGKEFPYKEVVPKTNRYHNTPVAPTEKKKEQKPEIWKGKFNYPGIPLRYLFKGGKYL